MRWLTICRKHGPFCTGGPMHLPLIPENAFERVVARILPPLTWDESQRLYAEHLDKLAAQAGAERSLSQTERAK